MVNCDINIVRLLEKAALYLTKIQFGIRTDGRVIEQTEKPLEFKDKYITNVFKGYTFSEQQKKTANRGGNRTGGRELKKNFCISINTL